MVNRPPKEWYKENKMIHTKHQDLWPIIFQLTESSFLKVVMDSAKFTTPARDYDMVERKR